MFSWHEMSCGLICIHYHSKVFSRLLQYHLVTIVICSLYVELACEDTIPMFDKSFGNGKDFYVARLFKGVS